MKWTLRENAGGLLSGYPRRGLRRAGASRDSRGDLERPAALSAVIGARRTSMVARRIFLLFSAMVIP